MSQVSPRCIDRARRGLPTKASYGNADNRASRLSIFSAPALDARLRAWNTDTLILSGVETDVCVYSSALAAVDLGYTVVLAADALASPDDRAHHAVLTRLAPRLPEQIKVMSTNAILKAYAMP